MAKVPSAKKKNVDSNFVLIVSVDFKVKSLYISPFMRIPKVESKANFARFDNSQNPMVEAHKPKPMFRPHPMTTVTSNFVPT